MNLLDMMLQDPVILFSFGGLAILFGICGYYVWYFLKNIEESNSDI